MGLGNFLKSKFTQKKAIEPITALQSFDYESMSLRQIMEYFSSGQSMTADIGISLTRRLFELAYFDINSSNEEQDIAKELLEKLIKEMENGLANSAESLQSYRKANEFMYKSIPRMGRGSLAWKVELAIAKGDDSLNVLIDPSSGPLYPDYIESIGEENWKKQKPGILKALIRDRKRNGESNATIILASLVCATDPVAWNILSPTERINLMSVSKDYYKARAILVNNGILPTQQNALSFEPRRDSDFMGAYLIQGLNDVNVDWRSALSDDLNKLSSEQQDFIFISITPLRIKLTIGMLQDIYGEEYAEAVKNKCISMLKTSWDMGLTGIYSRIEEAETRYFAEHSDDHGLDGTIAAGLLAYLYPNPNELDDDTKMSLWNLMIKVFNADRIHWMQFVRFLIRSEVNQVQANSENFELTETEAEIFGTYGSDVLKKTTIYEDTIGIGA